MPGYFIRAFLYSDQIGLVNLINCRFELPARNILKHTIFYVIEFLLSNNEYGMSNFMTDKEKKPSGREIRLTSLSTCAG